MENASSFNGRITRAQAKKLNIDMTTNGLEFHSRKRKIPVDDQMASKRRKLNSFSPSDLDNVRPTTSKQADLAEEQQKTKSDELAMPIKTADNSTMSSTTSTHKIIATSTNNLQVAVIDFKIDEIVWAKIKGYPAWPAKVLSFPSNKMVLVQWFNDYRKTKVYRTQLFKFLINFERFSTNFNRSVGLKTAAREALFVTVGCENSREFMAD